MLARLRDFVFGNLRRQLTIGIVAVVTLTITLFVWDLTRAQQAAENERHTKQLSALASSAATTTASWVMARDFSGLQEIIEGIARYPNLEHAMVLDTSGQVLAHSDTARIGQYLSDLPAMPATTLLPRTANLLEVISPVMLGEQHVGWIRIGLDQTPFNAELAQMWRKAMAYIVAAALASILFAALAARYLTRRLNAIQQVAGAVKGGESGLRVRLQGNDEAAKLARHFNEMMDGLDQRQATLQESEQLFRIMATLAPVGIYLTDARGDCLFANDRWCEMAGMEPAAVLGQGWMAGVHPDDRELVLANWDRMVESGGRWSGLEYRFLTPGGKETWVEALAAPQRNQAGEVVRYVGINVDITDRKEVSRQLEELVARRTSELSSAKEVAEAANRAKSVFLANMSHELRTPLNAVLGFSQLLQRDQAMGAESRARVATINRAGQHLLSLINDVLEISRIEAGRVEIQRAPFDLFELLTSVEEMVRVRAEAKSLVFSTDYARDLPQYVEGDGPHLKQILINLLGNAVKYTDAGSVQFTVAREGNTVRFVVADTGIGIGPDDRQRVFQPFYQTASGAMKGEGAGLGLTICQEYTAIMGGALALESEVGQGSAFTLALDLPSTELPAVSTVRAGHARVLAEGHAPVRVLVVDDKVDNRELMRLFLEGGGFAVRTASNGREAVDAVPEWQPHFIWMDMRMPVLDGYAATREIRALPGGAEVRIVALTASAFEEDRQQILACGCDDMVRKPVEEARLFDVMGDMLSLRYRDTPVEEPPQPAPPARLDLSQMAPAMLAQIRQSAEMLDIDGMQQLIAQLRGEQPAVADGLAALAQSFRFDRIFELCAAQE